jgi:hypothetical protein
MDNLAIKTGDTLQAGKSRIVSIDEKRIVVERVSTGSRVNVARKLVEKTRKRLAAGEPVAVHASGPNGGISYTSTIELTVIAALGNVVKAGRVWVLS